MAETLEQLCALRDEAEQAARLADIAAGRGEHGAAREAERLHAAARALNLKVHRAQQTPDDILIALRAQWDRTFETLTVLDRKITEMERIAHAQS